MQGKYSYMPRYGHFNIYNPQGVKVDQKATKEEAKAEVYRLNGWKLPQR
jgi:hypothetical protein